MIKIVGIGEYYISKKTEEIIKTFSLGSCVALTIHCPKRKVSGMAHIALPYLSANSEGLTRPAHYAETAIPLMLNKFCNVHGCIIGDLIVGIYGGALSILKNDVFKIGQRNVQAIYKFAIEKGIFISRNETGGNCSRTVELEVGTGIVRIDSHPLSI